MLLGGQQLQQEGAKQLSIIESREMKISQTYKHNYLSFILKKKKVENSPRHLISGIRELPCPRGKSGGLWKALQVFPASWNYCRYRRASVSSHLWTHSLIVPSTIPGGWGFMDLHCNCQLSFPLCYIITRMWHWINKHTPSVNWMIKFLSLTMQNVGQRCQAARGTLVWGECSWFHISNWMSKWEKKTVNFLFVWLT